MACEQASSPRTRRLGLREIQLKVGRKLAQWHYEGVPQ